MMGDLLQMLPNSHTAQPSTFPPQALSQPDSTDVQAVLQVIVFNAVGHQLALPAAIILKVMNYPADRQTSHLGVLYIGQAAVKVLNLRSQQPEVMDASPPERFLIILQSRPGELCGIGVDQPPDLLDLSLSSLQPLPATHQTSYLLKMATHVARINQDGEVSTLFLLDPSRAP
jgi:chemotaxis signal transduction protein